MPPASASDDQRGATTRWPPQLERSVDRLPVTLAIVVVFAILYLRGLAIVLDPQPIWDDKNFIADGILYGGPGSWFKPYAGYILVLPRMLSDGFTIFNLLDAPWWGMIISLAGMAWAYSLILSRGFEYLMPRPWRAIVVAGVTLMPWYTELYASLPHIQWSLYIVLALFSIADYDAMSRPAGCCHGDRSSSSPPPNSVLTFSVSCAGAGARRNNPFRHTLFSAALMLLCGARHNDHLAHAKLLASRIDFSDRPDIVTFLHFLVKGVGSKSSSCRCSASGLLTCWHFRRICVSFVAWLALAAGAIPGADAVGGPQFALAAIVLLMTIVFRMFRNEYVVAHFIRDGQYFGADRYFLPASVFFYVTLVWLMQSLESIPARSTLLAVAGIGFLLVAAVDFEYPARPDFKWRDSVLNYYRALLSTHGASPNPSEYRIVVHPPAFEWHMVLPLYELSPAERHRIEAIVDRNRRQ